MSWDNLLLDSTIQIIFFALLNLLLLTSAASLGFNILKNATTRLKLLGIIILMFCIQQAVFYLLSSIRLYSPLAALILLLAINFLTNKITPLKITFNNFLSALDELSKELKSQVIDKIPKSILYVIYILSIFLFAYALTAPMLGWDGITYHAVKAAYWVKEKGYISLIGPGGWLVYRNRLAAGEIYTSWFMLPGSNDNFLPLGELFIWLSLGFSIYALAIEAGLKALPSAISAIYILFLPATLLLIGSTYVEPFLFTLIISALAFLIYLKNSADNKTIILLLVTLALAAATKVSVWIFAAFISAWAIGLLLFRRKIYELALAVTAALILFLPQLISNYLETGYPLAFENISIGGLTLGRSIEAKWYAFRKVDSNFSTEISAFLKMFSGPLFWEDYHLSILSLPILIVGLIALFFLKGYQRILFVLSCISLLLPLYTAEFKVIRIIWANATSRFWVPVITITLIALMTKIQNSSLQKPLGLVVLSFAIINLSGFLYGIQSPQQIDVIVNAALLLTALLLSFRLMLLRKNNIYKIILLSLLFFETYALCSYSQKFKFNNLESFRATPYLSTYWADPSIYLNPPVKSLTIAVTSGEAQNLDNWYIYYLLGSNFQNNLTYVSPLGNGRLPVWDGNDNPEVDYNLWLERLHNKKVDYVMSFYPQSQELIWMQSNPDKFSAINYCTNMKCGLYEIIKSPAKNHL